MLAAVPKLNLAVVEVIERLFGISEIADFCPGEVAEGFYLQSSVCIRLADRLKQPPLNLAIQLSSELKARGVVVESRGPILSYNSTSPLEAPPRIECDHLNIVVGAPKVKELHYARLLSHALLQAHIALAIGVPVHLEIVGSFRSAIDPSDFKVLNLAWNEAFAQKEKARDSLKAIQSVSGRTVAWLSPWELNEGSVISAIKSRSLESGPIRICAVKSSLTASFCNTTEFQGAWAWAYLVNLQNSDDLDPESMSLSNSNNLNWLLLSATERLRHRINEVSTTNHQNYAKGFELDLPAFSFVDQWVLWMLDLAYFQGQIWNLIEAVSICGKSLHKALSRWQVVQTSISTQPEGIRCKTLDIFPSLESKLSSIIRMLSR